MLMTAVWRQGHTIRFLPCGWVVSRLSGGREILRVDGRRLGSVSRGLDHRQTRGPPESDQFSQARRVVSCTDMLALHLGCLSSIAAINGFDD